MIRTLRHVLRLLSIARILARHDALFPLEMLETPPLVVRLARLVARRRKVHADLRDGERLALALQELGPSFIKLGQILSVRADLLGEELAADLGALRDRLPPFSFERARATVEAELGRPLEELFETFDETPVAAASIAQVHFATLPPELPRESETAGEKETAGEEETSEEVGGEEGVSAKGTAGSGAGAAETPAPRTVAVKVLRPGVEAAFHRDLDLFFWMAEGMERAQPSLRRLRPMKVVETLARSVELEMDLRLEAAAASELAENFAHDPAFRVPAIDWPRTARRVMTMERIEGIRLSDRDALIEAGFDLPAIANNVIRVFLQQALHDGFFHADMHQGNLFVGEDGELIAVDFGIMGRLDKATRLFMAEMLLAFLLGDYRRAAEVHFEAGYVPAGQSLDAFTQACRSVGEPIIGKPVSEISLGRLLLQLFQVTETFDMHTQPQLLLLQKTMVTAEGVARGLDPNVNFWEASQPTIEEWAREHLGPAARLRETAATVADLARRLPALVEKAEGHLDRMGEAGLRLDEDTTRRLARELRAGRRGQGAMGFALGVALAAALAALLL